MKEFDINFLDHVAIRVRDIEVSAQWYEKVLFMTRCNLPEWKNFPVFMSCGKAGVAIFPANTNDVEIDKLSKNSRIDHFAFNVTNENFEKAKRYYEKIGQEFEFQDHYYFHSIYTKDPDGNSVELTTIVVNEKNFYK